MKTKRFLTWIMMFFAVAIIACDKEEDAETCDSEDLTEDFSCPVDVNAIASFCSDGVNNSYYTFNGVDYQCDGVSASTCDDALNDIGVALLEEGCSAKKSGSMSSLKIKLSAMAENLLEEVRTQSVCY
ncbi:MAG: hypothetical protein R6V16_08930 [Bacteroidales bacterium]